MIEGVTFDWWNTLAVTSPDQDQRLRALRMERLAPALARLSQRPPPEALLAADDRQTEILEAAWAGGADPPESQQDAPFLPLSRRDAAAPAPSHPPGGGFHRAPPEVP